MIEIRYIQEIPIEIEEKVIESLVDHFNEESKKQNSKFKIGFSFGHPHLVKGNWIFQDYSNKIVFHGGYFTFVDGLDLDIFNKIKSILEEIPELFKINISEN